MMDIFDAAAAIAAQRGLNETAEQVLEASAAMLLEDEPVIDECITPDELSFFLERNYWAGDPEGIGEHLQECAACSAMVAAAKGGAV